MAYGLNSDVFDSWTNAPNNGLSNQGTTFDVDIAGRDQQAYGKNMALMFWTGVTAWAINNFADRAYTPQEIAADVANLSGGVIGSVSLDTAVYWHPVPHGTWGLDFTVTIQASPGSPLLGPPGTPGPPPPTGDQVSATPAGGPSSMTAPMALPFAPDPTYVKGYCPTGYHWQPYPFNPAAGACYLSGPLQPMP
jgi:hypothetical protein